jgi:hypothetical protein
MLRDKRQRVTSREVDERKIGAPGGNRLLTRVPPPSKRGVQQHRRKAIRTLTLVAGLPTTFTRVAAVVQRHGLPRSGLPAKPDHYRCENLERKT